MSRPGPDTESPAPGPAPGEPQAAARPTGPDQRLSRRQRVTRTAHFREAYAQGRRWIGRTMVLWLRAGEGASLRLGVVTSRKVGESVARSRARRLLREAYRRHRHRFSGPYDVVLIARASILRAPWGDIVAELLRLAALAGLLKSGPANDPPR